MRTRALLAALAVALLAACTQSPTAPSEAQTPETRAAFGSGAIGTNL